MTALPNPTTPLSPEALAPWFSQLQRDICQRFEALENSIDHGLGLAPGRFTFTPWAHPQNGGGTMAVMRGRVFEKVGVNVSMVHGALEESFRAHLPDGQTHPYFWAAGISLVAHMHSPHIPAVHFNTRCIRTKNHWFGGGMDMTPTFPDPLQTTHFHDALNAMCAPHDPTYYPRFKQWCDEYFFLKHRNEPRGIGGLFFDYINSGNEEADIAFLKDNGRFMATYYPAVVEGLADKPWTPEERDALLIKRGRYVEFNLLYDRGTQFGFKTNGNTEAILMSMPPCVKWP